MNKQEAKKVLAQKLQEYRVFTYQELSQRIEDIDNSEVVGPSGISYQVQIQVIWDDKPNGLIRVLGSIDDGGWRAFFPLGDDFLLAPDGTFVGE